MWRLLSSLWSTLRGRPPAREEPPAGRPSPQAPGRAAGDTLHPGDRSPSLPEPFSVVEGSPEGYRVLELLGRGSTGEVHRALAPDGRAVALKRIGTAFGEPSGATPYLEPFRSLRHPFLLETLACYVTADQVVLVTE